MTEQKHDYDQLVRHYIAMWNEPDAAVRADLVGRLMTEDASFTDPVAAVSGPDEIAGFVGAVRERFAGHVFRARPGHDGHHDLVRVGWELVPDTGGEPPVVGFDVAVLADAGRVRAVHGFFDRVPAA